MRDALERAGDGPEWWIPCVLDDHRPGIPWSGEMVGDGVRAALGVGATAVVLDWCEAKTATASVDPAPTVPGAWEPSPIVDV